MRIILILSIACLKCFSWEQTIDSGVALKREIVPIPYCFEVGFNAAMKKSSIAQMKTWEDASGGKVRFKKVSHINPYFGYGIVFRTATEFQPNIFATTTRNNGQTKKLLISEVVMNVRDYRWKSGPLLDKVLLHEIGHTLGFAHSSLEDSIMYETNIQSVDKLSADDIDGLRTVYN